MEIPGYGINPCGGRLVCIQPALGISGKGPEAFALDQSHVYKKGGACFANFIFGIDTFIYNSSNCYSCLNTFSVEYQLMTSQ